MPTTPGIHQHLELVRYSGTNRMAIHRLADAFYVTRGFDPVVIGNSHYQAVLVRPTDDTSIYLNTDRELLVLFADFDTFEIRTLEAYDEFYNLVESKRVDKSIRFLVSNDSRVHEHIKRYLQANPEYPIIVPLTYDQLHKTVNPLLTAIRANYVIRDLFGYQAPLREEHFFFGRSDTVNAVLDLAKSGQNSSIFGLRKSGKTSAIFAIQRRSKAFDVLTVHIDCQNPSVHARGWADLLNYVVSRIRIAAGLKTVSHEALSSKSHADVSEQFTVRMQQTLAQVRGYILVVFDEIEQISPSTAASEHWRTGQDPLFFWQTLRSFLQTDARGRLAISIVGTSPNLLEAPKIGLVDNPMLFFAQKRFIPNLSFDAVREMVSRLGYFMGLEFPDQVISKLHGTYAGHPFFTRQVCSKIHQISPAQRPVVVSLNQLKEAEDAFRSDLENYLRDVIGNLEKLYPEEFKLLQAVTAGELSEVTEYADYAPDLIDHLIGYGLIEKRGKHYDVTFEAIRSVVRKGGKVAKTRDEMWAEIVVRRNHVEQIIRQELFFWAKNVKEETFISIIKRGLSKNNFSRLQSTMAGYLFSKTDSPLTMIDLIGLLNETEVIPYRQDRKQMIKINLHKLNSLRRDAHARDFTKKEFLDAVEALDFLDEEFSSPA